MEVGSLKSPAIACRRAAAGVFDRPTPYGGVTLAAWSMPRHGRATDTDWGWWSPAADGHSM